MGRASPEEAGEVARFGGAAADFVSSLGRKAAELRALATGSTDSRARDELRRKLHALGVGARLLHFDVLAHAIAATTEDLDRVAAGHESRGLDQRLVRLCEELPALALARTLPAAFASPITQPASTASPEPSTAKKPLASLPAARWPVLSILVIGEPALAHALESAPSELTCEVERTSAVNGAIALTRALAPDVVVVDAGLEGVDSLIEQLAEDALTGPAPVIVVDDVADARSEARFRARGATSVVARGEPSALRHACADTALARSRTWVEALHPEVGEVNVGELAERLSHEVRRALVDAADPSARDVRVSLGLGADILGPLWGALARVRDVVAARSAGAVRFRQDVVAPAIVAASAPSPSRERSVEPASPPSLSNHRVLVVDDDASVVDYVGGALVSAGAQLDRASDGEEALARARLRSPDAIVSDVLMPRMDGVALARAIRRDVVLRDRPIVLLSWKEDLLARMRDLGAGATAALRKESDTGTLVARVESVLLPRARLRERLGRGGELSGRLDVCTTASLLALVCETRASASVLLRDATYAFDIEVDEGGIRRLSRIDAAGARLFGAAVIPSLLGAGSGRFLVRARAEGEGAELEGVLIEQLAPAIAKIRAACDAVIDPRLAEVRFDEAELAAYEPACTPAVRAALAMLVERRAPAELMAQARLSPSALEDLLLDLATRGVLVGALSSDGQDLIAHAASQRPPPTPETLDAPAAFEAPIELDLGFDEEEAEGEDARISLVPASLEDAVLQSVDGGSKPVQRSIVDARELRPRVIRSDPPGRPRERISSTPTPQPAAPGSTPPPTSPSGAKPRSEPPSVRGAPKKSTTLSGLGAVDDGDSTNSSPRSGKPPEGR